MGRKMDIDPILDKILEARRRYCDANMVVTGNLGDGGLAVEVKRRESGDYGAFRVEHREKEDGMCGCVERGARRPARDVNMLAVAVAEALAQGRSREEIERISAFLQLVQTALKTYIR